VLIFTKNAGSKPVAPAVKPVAKPVAPAVKPVAKPVAPQSRPSNPNRDQMHAIQMDSSLSPQEKQAKLKALMEKIKVTPSVSVGPNVSFHDQMHTIQTDSSLSIQEKQAKMKALFVERRAKATPSISARPNVVISHDPFHDQMHEIQTDSSLSIQEKQDKMKVLIEERRVANAAKPNVATVNAVPPHQPSDPFHDKIHAIQTDASLSIQEKQDKMKVLMEERRHK
jgi:hypothetical protein